MYSVSVVYALHFVTNRMSVALYLCSSPDDYRLTAALCVLKRLPTQYTTTEPPPQVKDPAPTDESSTSQFSTSQSSTSSTESSDQSMTSSLSSPVIPEEAVQLALKAAKAFLSSLEHDDIEGSQHQLVS